MELAKEVEKEVERQLETLPRSEIARESINRNGAIFIVASLEEALKLSNEIAPEHLELHIKEPMNALDYVKHAGSIFLGPYAPEPLGDYWRDRIMYYQRAERQDFSPLSVDDFVKNQVLFLIQRKH